MPPSLYQYKQIEQTIFLHLIDFSTLECLQLFDRDYAIKSVRIGATNYKNFGWATEKELPDFQTVDQLIRFLEHETTMSLLEFELEIEGFCSLSTHNDEKCIISLKDKRDFVQIMKRIEPVNSGILIPSLLSNQDMYINLLDGKIQKYHSLDQYYKAN